MLLFLQLFFGVLIASSLGDEDYVFQGLLEEKRQMTPIELRLTRGVDTGK